MNISCFKFFRFIFLLSVFSGLALASDHIDGPVTTKHAVADVSDLYVFPNPTENGRLSLVLNAYPTVSPEGHFSEKVSYVFILRKAKLEESSKKIVTYDETKITCSFKTPHAANYSVLCKSDKGLFAKALIDDKTSLGDFRVFAGMRSDPFFLNLNWVKSSMEKGRLIDPSDDNLMDKLNILSVVIDIDIQKIFKDYHDELIAVAARSITQDSPSSIWRQLDWVGRPEITNFSLSPNSTTELRDKYNKEIPFRRPLQYEQNYFERLYTNIRFHYDKQDGKEDWNESETKQLVSLLLDDYLLVAPHLACDGDRFFEIERSLLKAEKIDSCGGRKLTDDITDKVLSLYITSHLDELSDGVDHAYRKVSDVFPYLATPDTSFSARMKAWVIRKLN